MQLWTAAPPKRTYAVLNADLAFKMYILVAVFSTSGLDMLLFVTILLLTLTAILELVHVIMLANPLRRAFGRQERVRF